MTDISEMNKNLAAVLIQCEHETEPDFEDETQIHLSINLTLSGDAAKWYKETHSD